MGWSSTGDDGERLRIAVFSNYCLDHVGGAEEGLDQLASHWCRGGHDVVLFCPRPRRNRQHRPWEPAYRQIYFPRTFSNRIGLSRYVGWLRREHQRAPFDIVMGSDIYWASHVCRLFCREAGVPLVATSQGGDVMHGSRFLKRPVCMQRIKEVIRDAAALPCISSYVEGRLRSLATPTGVVKRIVNGWPDEWQDRKASPRAVVPGDYVFGMGRLVGWKGFGVLLAAYRRLRKQHPNLSLVIAGDGPEREPLMAEARRLGMKPMDHLPGEAGQATTPRLSAGQVYFPGFVHARTKRSLIDHATVGVCSSIRQEPQGIVLLEMMCRGLPVIASRMGGIPDVVQPNMNGTLFAAGRDDELASQLEQVLKNPQLRERLSAGAKQSVAQFNWQHAADSYLQLFRQVALVPVETDRRITEPVAGQSWIGEVQLAGS